MDTGVVSLSIVKFCSEEVERQQDVPTAVYWMVNAWMDAIKRSQLARYPSLDDLRELGQMVHPIKNTFGFRRCSVFVGDRRCPDHEDVVRLLTQLLYHVPDLEPWESYKEFEMIHPFVDGNGRVGKILFNWLSGTLTDPIMPPNIFNCANP